MEEMKNAHTILVIKVNGGKHMRDLGKNYMIILKWVLRVRQNI
jgi:hypothetical protein